MNRIILIGIFILTGVQITKAQFIDNPIFIEIAVLPPYSTSAIDYFTSATQTVVTVVNPTLQAYDVFIAGGITNISTQQGATIRNDQVPPVPALRIEPGVRILTGNDLAPFISASAIQFNGLSDQQVANGNLPEGEYQICLQFYDYQSLQIRSQPEPAGCSNIFTIQFIQPPILIAPTCSSDVMHNPVQNILFTWIPPPFAVLSNALLSYQFRLIEVPQGMSAIQAMQSTTIPVLQENTLFNVFLYSVLQPTLISGRQYAWQVKVSDLANNTLFSNNGESEICEFRMGLPNPFLTPVSASIAYPAPNSRTPFQRVPVIVKFEPIDSTYRFLSSNTEIKDPEGVQDLVVTQTPWPQGPDAYLMQQIGAPPTLNQLQHVQVGRNLASFPGAAEWRQGKNFEIKADITLEMADGTEKFATASGIVSRGLNKPVPKHPALDTVYLNNNRIFFTFKTTDTLPPIPGQMGLLPPAEIIRSLKGNQSNLFKAEVRERYRLEVARDVGFDSIVSSFSNVFNVDENITQSTNVNFLKSRIYRDITKELYVPDTGQYFWRVHWLLNPFDSASAPYETSNIFRFRIMGPLAADTARGACIADCNASPINDRNPVTTLQPDQMVKVGKFNMKVQTVAYFGPLASGTGLIKVEFLNTTVKVQFTNALINAQNQLYQGNVAASYDDIGLIPNIPGLGQLRVNNLSELMDYVENDRYSSIFDPTVPMGLPFGFDKIIEGDRYMVAIVGMSFEAERATLAAAVAFPMPFLPSRTSDGKMQHLGLGASNICFHPNGLAGLGMGALYLAEPVEFDYAPGQFIQFKNSIINPTTGMVADSGTYVSWDCDGFRALHVNGEVSFSNELLQRATKDGRKSLKDVKARFKFNVRRSGNWLAALDFDPFIIKGIDDWNFVVQEATLDFSDLENPTNMVFPQNYAGDRSVLWNGFHLKSLKVGLPKDFKIRFPDVEIDEAGKDSVLKDRIVVSINDLLIDRTGLSGKIEALRLLELENGIMAGWAFSVDTLNVEFVSNSFIRGGFNGKIKTPLTPDVFKYTSILSQSNDSSGLRYAFNVLPQDTITVPLWAATMNLLPTSHITIVADTSGFKPELVLNGSIDIMQKIGEIDVRFAGVRFETLKLQTIEPMLSCSSFTFSSPQKVMAGFPVSVSNIQLTNQDFHGLFSWDDTPGPRQALVFTVNVNIMGESNTFGASTTLAILGRFDAGDLITGGNEFPSLKLTGIDLKTINIQGDLGFVELTGFINFYAEDPQYGQGFVGGISATFIKCINVSVIGCFGEVNSMRYWYVDAMAKFNPGINLSVPSVPPVIIPIDLYGFGGGAFYRMSLQSPPAPDAELSTKTPDGTPTPGTTLSNLRLVPNSNPNANPRFGLMATVVLGSTGGGQAFNCDVTLAVDFNDDGGINSIGFSGNGYFMSTVFERDFTAVSASVILVMNMPTKTLTGNFSVMINVPNVLEGYSNPSQKLAGEAHLLISPNTWHILAGTPARRNRIRIANALTLENYLMVGMNLPAPALPPREVTDRNISYKVNRGSAISSGSGFAFGASAIPSPINERFGPFRARFHWGMGFDMNLLDYASARCDGMPPGTQMGINGWYARGSVWAHFKGSISLTTDVFGDITIMEGRAAALLDGGFPNPAWATATLDFGYEVLNGLYKGNCKFNAKYGESCRPVLETPIAGLKMIAAVTPEANLQETDCRTLPVAIFNVDIDREIVFPTVNSSGIMVYRRFRFLLEEFVVLRNNVNVAHSISKKQDGSQAMYLPNAMLAPLTNYTIRVVLKAEELVNNQWRLATRNDNSNIRETVTQTFRTGSIPNHITDNDVQFSYPFNRQRYFCKNQCSNGIIHLKQSNWGHLFSGNPPSGYTRTYVAQFEPNGGGTKLESTVTYSGTTIRFNLPNDLMASKLYRIRILRKDNPIQMAGGINNLGIQFANVGLQFRSLYGTQVIQTERTVSNFNALGQNEHLIYQYFFRTSSFNTLSQKVTAIQVVEAERDFDNTNESIVLKMFCDEPLEDYELNGYPYTIGFQTQYVKILEITDEFNSSWHNTFVTPIIYNTYNSIVNNNYSTLRLQRDNPDLVGIPPNRITQTLLMKDPISDSEIDPSLLTNSTSWAGQALNIPNTTANTNIHQAALTYTNGSLQSRNSNIRLLSLTSFQAQLDYNRLKTIVANMRVNRRQNLRGVDNTTKNRILNLDASTYNYMWNGSYTIRMRAFNPVGCLGGAGNTINTTKIFNYGGLPQMRILFIQATFTY